MLSLLLCFFLPSAFGAGAEAPLRTYPQHRRQHAAALMRNWIAQGHHYKKNGDISNAKKYYGIYKELKAQFEAKGKESVDCSWVWQFYVRAG